MTDSRPQATARAGQGQAFRGNLGPELLQPNCTLVPDNFFDYWLARLDTMAELKVLLYVFRRTLGFKRGSDYISLEQMQHGIRRREDGSRVDWGTNLGRAAILAASRSLVDKGLLEVISAGPGRGHETLYRLRLFSAVGHEINWSTDGQFTAGRAKNGSHNEPLNVRSATKERFAEPTSRGSPSEPTRNRGETDNKKQSQEPGSSPRPPPGSRDGTNRRVDEDEKNQQVRNEENDDRSYFDRAADDYIASIQRARAARTD